jgi:hypothetical protein
LSSPASTLYSKNKRLKKAICKRCRKEFTKVTEMYDHIVDDHHKKPGYQQDDYELIY